jgi:hypothetical protein
MQRITVCIALNIDIIRALNASFSNRFKALLPHWEQLLVPVMPDDHSKSVPPLPIPNRTVKRLCADDSAATSVKVGYRQASYKRETPCRNVWGFFSSDGVVMPPWLASKVAVASARASRPTTDRDTAGQSHCRLARPARRAHPAPSIQLPPTSRRMRQWRARSSG